MERKELDSDTEWYFTWYLDELIEAGYLRSYSKVEHNFPLTEDVTVDYIKPMKRVPDKKMTQNIMKGHSYTPDFDLHWEDKAIGIFCQDLNKNEKINTPYIYQDENFSCIEIKGDFDMNNMTRLVMLNIKSVYDKYKIFIQVVKLPLIFKKTFTPERYLTTNKTGKPRSIKFKTRTLQEYVESLNK